MTDLIRKIERFADLPEPVLAELSRRGRIREARRGDSLFFEGDDCTHVYFVISGTAKVSKTLESGKEFIVDIIGPGEAVGEVALIDQLPYPASASVHDDGAFFSLSREDYLYMLGKHPEIALASIRDLANRMRTMNRRLKDVSGGNVEYRIAHLLLTLGDRIGKTTGNQMTVEIALSRQEMADMVGTSIETAIRIMSRWRKESLVETADHGFKVLDVERLRKIGEVSL